MEAHETPHQLRADHLVGALTDEDVMHDHPQVPEPPSLPGAAAGHLPHLHDGLSTALYCGLLAIDIVEFGRRPGGMHADLRAGLNTLLVGSLMGVGVPLGICRKEDRGDAVFVVLPPGVSIELLLGPFPLSLQTQLRLHNRRAAPAAHLRIRAAVTAGFVWADADGVMGRPATELFRLLDAPQYKAVLADQNADLGLITAERLYTELVTEGPGLIDPDSYLPITLDVKEYHGSARLWLPPVTRTLPAPPRLSAPPASAIRTSHRRYLGHGPG
ncbi:hypothetical protein [Spirillospora sp. NPDC047279]|uniref:hypothetical protein n=1 Tax=Spirillospora sp. NPDC047279 TaxID=3155478 RepID=UPI0033CFBB35